jgi:PKD domain
MSMRATSAPPKRARLGRVGPPASGKARAWVLTGAAVAIACALWAWRRDAAPPAARAPEAESTARLAPSVPLAPPSSLAPGRPAAPPVDPNKPIVDSVTVDKVEVCRGEQNFINVQARTANGTDRFLGARYRDPDTGAYVFGGSRLPFTLEAPPRQPVMITIDGTMAATSVPVPDVVVKDCESPPRLKVRLARAVASPDRIVFTAELVAGKTVGDANAGAVWSPTSYAWDFGDGAVASTPTNHVEHSYEGRLQNVRQSSFVATVDATDAAGHRAGGTAAVAFFNAGFGPLYFHGRVAISTGIRPDAAGGGETIWLYHGYDQPVVLESATLVETVRADGSARESFRREYAPAELLGMSNLPAGTSRMVRDLGAYRPTSPNTVREIELRGRTSDGKEAFGGFTLLAAAGVARAEAADPRAP